MTLSLPVHSACQNALFAATQHQCSTKMASGACTVVKDDAELPMFQTIWGKWHENRICFTRPVGPSEFIFTICYMFNKSVYSE